MTTITGQRTFDQFRNTARSAINDVKPAVVHLLTNGNLPEGATWHPNGFAVFRLGSVQDFATQHSMGESPWLSEASAEDMLRLHVWPKNLRKPFADQPRTHSHSFWLTSQTLGGSYVDGIFAASSTPQHTNAPASHRNDTGFGTDPYGLLDVCYVNPDLAELVPNGETAFVSARGTRHRTPGNFHHMPAGVFHRTEIPDDEFCMTLLVTSAERSGTDQIIQDIDRVAQMIPRAPITSADLAHILDQTRAEIHRGNPQRSESPSHIPLGRSISL